MWINNKKIQYKPAVSSSSIRRIIGRNSAINIIPKSGTEIMFNSQTVITPIQHFNLLIYTILIMPKFVRNF